MGQKTNGSFGVYRYKQSSVPLVLDVQADLLSELNTCVVIPLIPKKTAKQEPLPKLKPIVQINGKNYILMTTDIGTVTRNSLGSVAGNIEDEYRKTVIDALDFLFQGF